MQDNLKNQAEDPSPGTSTNDFAKVIIKARKRKYNNEINETTMKNKTKIRKLTTSNRFKPLANKEDNDDIEAEGDTDEEAQE